jgi:hypothetical protein
MTVAAARRKQRKSLLFKLFGPADVSPYDPTPAAPSDQCCDICNRRWTEHEIVRYERASRAICPKPVSGSAAVR